MSPTFGFNEPADFCLRLHWHPIRPALQPVPGRTHLQIVELHGKHPEQDNPLDDALNPVRSTPARLLLQQNGVSCLQIQPRPIRISQSGARVFGFVVRPAAHRKVLLGAEFDRDGVEGSGLGVHAGTIVDGRNDMNPCSSLRRILEIIRSSLFVVGPSGYCGIDSMPEECDMCECPKCGSDKIRRSRRWGILPFWLVLPLARCLACGHLFRVPFWAKMGKSGSSSRSTTRTTVTTDQHE